MKTNEQMLEDLIKRKEIYDKRQAVKRRRFAVISATLAVILLVSSIPLIAFVAANKKTSPDITDETTAFDTGVKEKTTDEETELSDTFEYPGIITYKEEIFETDKETEAGSGNTSHTVKPGVKITETDFWAYAYFFKDGDSIVKISTEPMAKREWRTNSVEREYALYNHFTYSTAGPDSEGKYKEYIAKITDGDINECEIRVFCNKEHANEKADLYIAIENGELLSDDIIEIELNDPSVSEKEYISIPVRFKFKNEHLKCRIRYAVVLHAAYDQNTEEINAGVNKTNINEFFEIFKDFSKTILSYTGARLPSGEVEFAKIRKAVFMEQVYGSLYSAPDLYYEASAYYFGDVDENGVPLFISDPYMPEYYENSFSAYRRFENTVLDSTDEVGIVDPRDGMTVPIIQKKPFEMHFISTDKDNENAIKDVPYRLSGFSYGNPIYFKNGVPHTDVMEYELTLIKNNTDSENVYLYISEDDGTRLLSDSVYKISFAESDTEKIKIKFRYADGASSATIHATVFDEKNGAAFLKDHSGNGYDLGEIFNTGVRFIYDTSFNVATVQGYDFSGTPLGFINQYVYEDRTDSTPLGSMKHLFEKVDFEEKFDDFIIIANILRSDEGCPEELKGNKEFFEILDLIQTPEDYKENKETLIDILTKLTDENRSNHLTITD